MKASATIKSEQTKHNAAVKDLALKPGQDVRGGIVVTKVQDCASTGTN